MKKKGKNAQHLGRFVQIILKKNHFQVVCKFKKKNVERVEENETNMQVFSVKNENKNVEKIEQKEKDFILYNFDLDRQMDTSSEVTLIPRNFWERIGKSILRKSSLVLRQFDGLVIKTLGYFEGSLELEDKFQVIPIIITTCKKKQGTSWK